MNEVKAKPCPKCGEGLEKSVACNHMTCTCKTHFCYICGVSIFLLASMGKVHTIISMQVRAHSSNKWKSDLRLKAFVTQHKARIIQKKMKK